MQREIKATAEQLLGDGRYAAKMALKDAVVAIDEAFGAGFAAKNPALVGAYVQAAAHAAAMAVHNRTLENCAEGVSAALELVATELQLMRSP